MRPRPDGHPWGVQVIGPAFADGLVAALAHDLSTATATGAATGPQSRPPRCAE